MFRMPQRLLQHILVIFKDKINRTHVTLNCSVVKCMAMSAALWVKSCDTLASATIREPCLVSKQEVRRLLGPVVRKPISANPGLSFHPGFFSVLFFCFVNPALNNPALPFFAAEEFWNNNRYTRLQTWQLLRLRVGFGANPRCAGYKDHSFRDEITVIFIRRNFFSLFIGREPPTWRANGCLRIKVCLCALSSYCVWLQMIFCSCVNETTLFSLLRSLLRENGSSTPEWVRSVSTGAENDRFASRRYSLKNKPGDRMIKQLLNSVIAKYRDLSVSRSSNICLSLRFRQIIDLLATDKLRYFAQPRPIIVF